MNGDLPEGWVVARIGEVCEVNPRKPPLDLLPENAPVTFVPMAAVDEITGTIATRETRAYGEVRKGYTAFADGDVILAKITPCFENGKAAIAMDLENELGFGSSEFHVLRPPGGVIAKYLYHYLRQPRFRDDAADHMAGTAGQERVSVDYIREHELPIPPSAEQWRIVEKVEALLARVSAARERLERVPRLLKRFRQAVLAAACEGRLTEGWRGSSGTESWVHNSLRDSLLQPMANGRSVRDQIGGFPVLRLTALRDGHIDLRERKEGEWGPEEARRFLVKKGDFLVARGNGSLRLVGRGGLVVEEPDPVAYPDTLIRVRPDPSKLLPEFLRIAWDSPLIRSQLEAAAHTSAGIHKLSQSDLGGVQVPLPPIVEQGEIVRQVAALFSLAGTIERRVTAALTRAEKLPQAILSRAFAGELVPTEAELARAEGRSYETAAELLERIRSERAGAITARVTRRAAASPRKRTASRS